MSELGDGRGLAPLLPFKPEENLAPNVVIASPDMLANANIIAAAFNLPGIKITFDPPHVEVTDPAMSWSGAAKMFWNAVARTAGQRPPFNW